MRQKSVTYFMDGLLTRRMLRRYLLFLIYRTSVELPAGSVEEYKRGLAPLDRFLPQGQDIERTANLT